MLKSREQRSSAGCLADLPLTQVAENVRVPAPAIPAYIMVCGNCGNIRFHAASVVNA